MDLRIQNSGATIPEIFHGGWGMASLTLGFSTRCHSGLIFFFFKFSFVFLPHCPRNLCTGDLPLVLRAREPGLALLYVFCCGARRAEGNGACEVSKFSSKEECAPSQVAEEDTRRLIQQPNYQKTSRHSEDHFLDLTYSAKNAC